MTPTPENLQRIVATLSQLLLEANDPQVRARAATALGQLGVQEAIAILRQAALQDQETIVRLAIIDALVWICQPEQNPRMAETPKNQPIFNIRQVGIINTGEVTVQGDQMGFQQNYAQEQNLAEAAAQIQALLSQLSQTYQSERDRQVEAVKREAKRNPTFRQRLWSAAKSGGVEAVKQLLDYLFKNPVAAVVAESVKAFVEAEGE